MFDSLLYLRPPTTSTTTTTTVQCAFISLQFHFTWVLFSLVYFVLCRFVYSAFDYKYNIRLLLSETLSQNDTPVWMLGSYSHQKVYRVEKGYARILIYTSASIPFKWINLCAPFSVVWFTFFSLLFVAVVIAGAFLRPKPQITNRKYSHSVTNKFNAKRKSVWPGLTTRTFSKKYSHRMCSFFSYV